MAGVIPAIFASSIILFPGTITSWFGQGRARLAELAATGLYGPAAGSTACMRCSMQQPLSSSVSSIPRWCSTPAKQQITEEEWCLYPGIVRESRRRRYIDKVMTRLTLAGALYITFICLVPQFLMTAWNVQFYFGGTSLLIIVVVIMDFMAQVQTHMMSHQYGESAEEGQPERLRPLKVAEKLRRVKQ
jgi:preprotein translocase subunit SecY